VADVARGLVRFVAAYPWSIGYFAAVVTTVLVGLVAGWLG
jgi:hypothetical protein